MGKTALMIIDVQQDMFNPENPVYQPEELLAKLAGLLEQARSTGTPVIFVQHGEQPGYPLEPGTPGWEIHPAIAPRPEEPVVHKRFPDSFQETNLQELLTAEGITDLIIGGIQTEVCVDTTCRRAFSLGYPVTLVQDAHSTWPDSVLSAEQIIAHHNVNLGGGFVKLKLASEISFTPAASAL